MPRLTSGSRSLGAPADLLGAPWLGQAGPDLANIYLHARYYDSSLGVFLSPDPAAADSNTYRYSSNDPVNRLDPSGLEGCELVGGRVVCNGEYVEVDGTNIAEAGTIIIWLSTQPRFPGLGFTPNVPIILAPSTTPTPTTPQAPESPETPETPETPNTPNSPQPGQDAANDTPAKEPFRRERPDPIAMGERSGCQSFGGRLAENFSRTNQWGGLTIGPPGFSLLAGATGASRRFVGAPSVFSFVSAARNGTVFAGGAVYATTGQALAAAVGTAAFNTMAVTASLEIGVLAGSAINAGFHVATCGW